MMPEMDALPPPAVRQLPGCEMIPILIMTALDDLESINRAYEVAHPISLPSRSLGDPGAAGSVYDARRANDE